MGEHAVVKGISRQISGRRIVHRYAVYLHAIHDNVFAVIIGFTLIAVGEKGQPLLNVIDSLNEVCLKIISTIMYFTPIGVFCTIVPVVEANGTETIISLATQLIILYLSLHLSYMDLPLK